MPRSLYRLLNILILSIFYVPPLLASDLPVSYSYYEGVLGISDDAVAVRKQPVGSALANRMDINADSKGSLYNWLRRRDALWENYKKARDNQTHSPTEFAKVQEQYIGSQGFYWTLTEDEFHSMIYNSAFSPRLPFKNAIQHPYNQLPEKLTGKNRVMGLILSPDELKRALLRLPRLIKYLERENFIFNEILVSHEADIVRMCNGWTLTHLSNWSNLNPLIELTQKQIDQKAENVFGPFDQMFPVSCKFPRNLNSERQKVLARIHCDNWSKHWRPFWLKIKKLPLSELEKIEDYNQKRLSQRSTLPLDQIDEVKSTFEKAYCGCDVTEEIPYTGQDASTNTNHYIYAYINVVKKRAYQATSNSIEPFIGTDGKEKISMATEYRSFQSLDFHRKIYPKALEQLKKSVNEREPEPDLDRSQIKTSLERNRNSIYHSYDYDPKNLKNYSKALETFKNHLKTHRRHHLKLHIQLTCLGVKSYIPTPWEVFCTKKPPQKITPLLAEEIDLSKANLRGSDLASGRVLKDYLIVNLAHNPGPFDNTDYGFSPRLKELNFRKCNLKTIEFMKNLQALVRLDISKNALDSNPVRILNRMISLTSLNIADNELIDVRGFNSLTTLKTLDISGNLIQSLTDLDTLPLETLHAGYIKFPISRKTLPAGLTDLKVLALQGYQEESQKVTEGELKCRYPILQTVTLDDKSLLN